MIGAAHQRKGMVCQDASLVISLRAPCGEHLQLLLVADGHGGSSYRLSHVGSRLACEQAVTAVTSALRSTPLHDREGWYRQLAHRLPAVLHQEWTIAAKAEWRNRSEAAEQPFCASLYGTTLGLLLLAPEWWGCTGIGDWDLVQVGPDGNTLISQECSHPGAGEATASLCLPDVTSAWEGRTQLHSVDVLDASFSLLISTDGVRKSCASDADFLELCCQMIQIEDPEELRRGMLEITALGSGDDLSVAIGQWSPSCRSATRPDAWTAMNKYLFRC